MPRAILFLLAIAALLTGACTPSGFLARQLVRAPRTFPQVVNPEPRVYYTFPDAAFAEFPLQLATVDSPAVTLAYRVVTPANYHTRLIVTNHAGAGPVRPLYKFKANAPGTPTAFTGRPRGTVVLLHGYGLNQDSMFPWALLLAEAGWRCVIVDLRGHGDSSGDRLYFGIREAGDLTALMDELARRKQASWPVAAVGVSYGAAVALRWESVEPRVFTAVAISPYNRLAVAVEGLRGDYAAWLPAGLLKRAVDKVPALCGVGPGGLDPVTWLTAKPVAALFVAGSGDVVASPAAVRELAELAAPPSRVVEVNGAGHEVLSFRIDEFAEPLRRWLEAAQPAP